MAKNTWETLRDATDFHISQGEETITDNLLLHLLRQQDPNIRVIKTPKHLESQSGTDWEWWIGNINMGYVRYAVQAKKLDEKTHRYSKLNHLTGQIPNQMFQHDVLRNYALKNNAIPLYAFYNHINLSSFNQYWNCPLPLEIEQLGITVTPLKNVKKAIQTWGQRTFECLHQNSDTIPLRCLVKCPHTKNGKGLNGEFDVQKFESPIGIYQADEISFLRNQDSSVMESFPAKFYDSEFGIYPKKILVVTRES